MDNRLLSEKLERLREAYSIRNEEWKKRNKKLGALRLASAKEASALQSFSLEQQIQDEETRCRELTQEIDDLAAEIESIDKQLQEEFKSISDSFLTGAGEKFTYEYRVGGPLTPDNSTYVTRKADIDLFKSLKSGRFCYVFNSRQMGKSSLRVRIISRLKKEGISCVTILTSLVIGSPEEMTEARWYRGVINNIVMDLGLYSSFDDAKWWREQEGLSGLQRFSKFIQEILLRNVKNNIVIFVDEVDRILSLKFNLDGFFAAIREFYNKRAELNVYNRLTFALIGVATPSDLIQNAYSTPFNIGHAINLTGFTLEEAQPLVRGLQKKSDNSHLLLQEILYWTNGQPLLTQKICSLVLESPDNIPPGNEKEWIQSLVKEKILNYIDSSQGNSGQDLAVHFKSISDRILFNFRVKSLLSLYRQIRELGTINANDSVEQIELRLSGLVIKKQNKLEICNPIYEKKFDIEWLDRSSKNLVARPYISQIKAWINSNYQNESYLLYGEALIKAKKWSEGILPQRDHKRFLLASEELEKNVACLDLQTNEDIIQTVFFWTAKKT